VERHVVRRKLMQRWWDEQGRELRSEILGALRENRALPHNRLAAFAGASDVPPGLDLRFIDLSGETLDGVNLSRAKLQGANLARASLKGANLVEAKLRGAFLRNTDLSNADLRDADFSDAIMEDVKLDGANLTGALLTDATIVAGATELPATVRRRRSSPWSKPLTTRTIVREQR
jgi:uncharacterized protein YjbI with pentapeptide repeats